ncbi:MAG: hypothetical protein ABSC03_04075 [Verrucomicrobiota bacterium]
MGMSGGEVIIILAVLFVFIVLPALALAAVLMLVAKRSRSGTVQPMAAVAAPVFATSILPGPVQVQGRPLKCLVCGHDTFRTSAPTPGRADVAYTCAQCGCLHWFMPT